MSRAVVLAAVCALAGIRGGQELAPRPVAGIGQPGFRLALTSFAATRAYATGTGTLVLVGTVRNEGAVAQPAEAVTLRMYALAGLDYMEGATIVRLPAMEPGASSSFRWKVQPTAPDAPLVAALTLEQADCLPQVRVLPIQHFGSAPSAFGAGLPPKPIPWAAAAPVSGWADNGKVRIRALHTNSEAAAAYLWSRTPGGWRQVAFAAPMLEAMSAEGAQEPWWEVFKAKRYSAAMDKTSATLTVSGQIGVRWRCSLSYTVRVGSSVVDCAATLSPRRRMSLSGVRLPRLHMGDGSFGAATSEQIGASGAAGSAPRGIRWGQITAGITLPVEPPFPGWRVSAPATPDGAEYTLVSAEYGPRNVPMTLEAGSVRKLSWRLYALAPSSTVHDALKVGPPR